MLRTEKTMDKIITVPEIGTSCLIMKNGQILKTSPIVDFFHNLLNDSWVITTQNTIYRS